MKKPHYTRVALLTLGYLIATSLSSSAAVMTQVGPGSGISTDLSDGIGSARLNFDKVTIPSLAAGNYDVVDFEYTASGLLAGDVQPFLASLSGTEYTILWAGPIATDSGVAGLKTITFTPESQSFTLAAETIVYAGFNSVHGVIPLANNVGNSAHNTITDFTLTSGDTIIPTLADLSRTYAFEINVIAIPEPATFAMLAAGMTGLMSVMLRRRRS